MELYALDADVAALEARIGALDGADRRSALAELAWHLRQRDSFRALSLAEELEADARELTREWLPLLLRLALVRAEIATLKGDLDRASQYLAEAKAGYTALRDDVGLGDAWLADVMLAQANGELAQAQASCLTAARCFADARAADRAQLAHAWAIFYLAFIDPIEAGVALAACLETAAQPAPGGLDAILAAAEAIICSARGETAYAAMCDARAFPLALDAGLLRHAVILAVNSGGWLQDLGDFDAAAEWIERGHGLALKTGWPSAIGFALARLGELLRHVGQLERSRDVLAEAIRELTVCPAGVNAGIAHAVLGQTLLTLGDAATAAEAFAAAISVFGRIGYGERLVRALIGEARALSLIDRPEEALDRIARARAAAEHDEIGSCDPEFARALAEIHGRHALPAPDDMVYPSAAIHYLEQARASTLEDGRTVPADLLVDLSRAWKLAGDVPQAFSCLEQALAAQERESLRKAANRAIAAQVRHEVERTRLESEHHRRVAVLEAARAATLQDATQTLEMLGHIGQEITSELQLQKVLLALKRHIQGLVDAASLLIFLMSEDGRSLELRYGIEDDAPITAPPIPIDNPQSNAVRALIEGHEILVELDEPETHPQHLPGTRPMRTQLFAPLRVGTRKLGVLSIQSPEAHAYGERERLIFQTMSAYGAIALANAVALEALRRTQAKLVMRTAELERLAMIDPLTGGGNRRHFMDRAAAEIEDARRSGRPLSVVMFDIDHFKLINDGHGHAAGDEVLRATVETCGTALRTGDFLARLGGEEFAILLPGAHAALAARVAERIRVAMEGMSVDWRGTPVSVTSSFGVAVLTAADLAIDNLLSRADAALYEAKQGGRNRVVSAD